MEGAFSALLWCWQGPAVSGPLELGLQAVVSHPSECWAQSSASRVLLLTDKRVDFYGDKPKVREENQPVQHHGRQQGLATPAAVASAVPGPRAACEGTYVWPK